ncbi:MAG: hypothetical protein P8184_02030 [Calditrichia bacterium]
MEVSFYQASSPRDTVLAFTGLKPGDQLAVRVTRRTAAFRYLASYRGVEFPINSAVSLKPRDLILIQLLKIQPRLQFKFLAIINEASEAGSLEQVARFFEFEKNPLSETFLNWSVRLNLPIKRNDYKRLKTLYSESTDSPGNAQLFLLPFFWLQSNMDTEIFHDPFFLMQWVFGTPLQGDPDENRESWSQDSELPSDEHQKLIFHQIQERLNEAFSLNGLFELLHDLQKQLKKINLSGRDHSLSKTEKLTETNSFSKNAQTEFYADFVKLLFLQIENYNRGLWIFIPFSSPKSKEKCFAFWRKVQVAKQKVYEFTFAWNSVNFNAVVVKGKIIEDLIELSVYNNNRKFQNFVEDHFPELRERLQKVGFMMSDIKWNPGKDFFAAIGKALFNNEYNNIEVKI